MEGKKQKRPDMQIYRPPRSKDRYNEEDVGKDSTEGGRKSEAGRKEDSRTPLQVQQQQQQYRSRVFRRRANRDDGGDFPEEEGIAPWAGQKQQQQRQDEGGGGGRRCQGKTQKEEGDGHQWQQQQQPPPPTSYNKTEDERRGGNSGLQQKQKRIKPASGRGRGGAGHSRAEYGDGGGENNFVASSDGRGRGGRGCARGGEKMSGRGNEFGKRQYGVNGRDAYDDFGFHRVDGSGPSGRGRGSRRGGGGGRGSGHSGRAYNEESNEFYNDYDFQPSRRQPETWTNRSYEGKLRGGGEEDGGREEKERGGKAGGEGRGGKALRGERGGGRGGKSGRGDRGGSAGGGRSSRRVQDGDYPYEESHFRGQAESGGRPAKEKGGGHSEKPDDRYEERMKPYAQQRGKGEEGFGEDGHREARGQPRLHSGKSQAASGAASRSRDGGNASKRSANAGGEEARPAMTSTVTAEETGRKRENVGRGGDSTPRHPQQQRSEGERGRVGVSRRTISGSSSRSATLEEEFREDQRLFNPYTTTTSGATSAPSAPSTASSGPDAHLRGRPHATGLIRLPANLNLNSVPPPTTERPVMVVRPNPVTMGGSRASGGVLHVSPAMLAATQADFWAHRGLAPDHLHSVGHFFTPQVELLWKEICDLDHHVSAIIGRHIGQVAHTRGPLTDEAWWHQVRDLRHQLMERHAALLMTDLELCNQRQSEQALWKTAFYGVIDPLKKCLDAERRPDLVETALQVITEGDTFFRSCVGKLEARYNVQIEAVWTTGYLPPETNSRRSSCLAFLSAQKLLLFLGDLARYQQLINVSNDYGMARTWYLRAQQLAPKNGRPYHQLAVLAMYTKRQMDAMYFYMRSLACGNPFTSASQALLALFDEVRRKVRDASRSRDLALRSESERGAMAGSGAGASGALASRQAVRVEIWIHPADGRRTKNRVDHRAEEHAEEDLQLLSFVELNKRFCLSFIHCHGMLFTRIGMEHFPERCALLLKEFRALLQYSPCAFSETQLLQLTFINIFNVDRASATAVHDVTHDHTLRSVLFEQATRLGMDIFALMAERACDLLDAAAENGENGTLLAGLPGDLRPLLPALCLWTDWMVVHPHAWRPPPSLLDPHLNAPAPDEWLVLARLCTHLDHLINSATDVPAVSSSNEENRLNKESAGSVVLSEERMSAGFKPMVNMEPQLYLFERNGKDGELALVTDYLRMDKLTMFAEFLCGLQTPYFEFDVNGRKYISLVPSLGSEKTTDGSSGAMDGAEPEEPAAADPTMAPDTEGRGEDPSSPGELEDLRRRKMDLEKQLKEQEEREAIVRSALAEGSQRLIELEIVPVFVLPDTNCYIDHLKDIRLLVRSKMFTIILPIIVLNELDGLCRGDDGSEPTRQIALRAKESVQFLEEEFEQRNSRLKAVTSKGSQLETIAFRSESIQQEGNNDDIILSCCLHYCVDKARDFMPRSKDEPYHLHREVVLLTSDRNLRLKAMGSNIPARPLPRFMAWAYP